MGFLSWHTQQLMLGDAAFGARCHMVADTDIGEGAPHHHFMVTPA
jgi:hypothetical protein